MSDVTPTTRITQLPLDECRDWILHAFKLTGHYSRNIRYAVDGKWEFLIVINNLNYSFSDVKTLTKIEKITEMILIKKKKSGRRIDGDDGELWFGRPIEQKKLQQWINDLISWSVYSRYRNLN